MTDTILWNDWHVVAKIEDLHSKSALSVRLLGEDLVLWRSGDRLVAWPDKCPHRGARLSLGKIANNTLICPYHGLAFNPQGQCAYIPAHPTQSPPESARIPAYHIQERYGLVWVCLGNPDLSVSLFPEWDDMTYRKFLCGSYRFHASGFRAIENFLDVSHFPFVHDGLLGDRNHTAVENYEIEVEPDSLQLRNIRVWQPDPDGTGKGGQVTYNYRVFRPLTTSFVKESAGNHKLAIFFTVTPVDEEECLGWMWIAMNYGYEIPQEELQVFQDKVVRQDIPIVESQRPKRLPLNLQAEFHLPCDRASIAYRKWLKRLGVTFGTI